MPNMTFFSSPKKMTLVVGSVSFLILLIPTCIELIPLGSKKNRDEDDFDTAKKQRDGILNQFNAKKEQIRENQQRVIDLDCAQRGYQEYNNNINSFYQNIIKSTDSPNTQLDYYWHLQFGNDFTRVDQSTETRSYDNSGWRYTYDYSCAGEYTCGKDTSCCYNYGYHWVSDTRYYSVITTIVNEYKNIIQGVGINTMSLNCGYYSRDFQIVPQTYMTAESNRLTSGDKRYGAEQVNFNREWGSRVLANFKLDGNVNSMQINAPRTVTQMDAGIELQKGLNQFLILAIAAFNATGINYSLVQENIRQSIPVLQKQAEEINTELQKKEAIFLDKKKVFDNSDNQYDNGLILWLCLLFGVPPILSLGTFLIVTQCNRCKDQNVKEIDLEKGKKTESLGVTSEEESRPILR